MLMRMRSLRPRPIEALWLHTRVCYYTTDYSFVDKDRALAGVVEVSDKHLSTLL